MGSKRYVLLDRDGTINVERHYLSAPEQIELLPNAAQGLAEMAQLGLGLIVVTNQSGWSRGYFDAAALDRIHERLRQLLHDAAGVSLDGIYCCPHLPESDCRCRKPLPGLIEMAANDLGFDPSRAFMIGDKPCDIDLGRAVQATTLLVRTGYGAKFADQYGLAADFIVDDLGHAAQVIGGLVS